MKLKIKKFAVLFSIAFYCIIGFEIRYVDAYGERRIISLYHIHTKEQLTILYKKEGKYIPGALQKINWILRDWRKNLVTEIDPKLIDIAWEMHEELGSHLPIHVICGYRSNETNEFLRKTRGGQAKRSQHISGKAIDLSFPDIPIRRLRYSAMIREHGGVGYYPTSAIPFVHIDTGHIRSWPRMPHEELALLFPHGHSRHISSEGRMLQPGDFMAARTHQPQLALEVAQFLDLREHPKRGVQIASADFSQFPQQSKNKIEQEAQNNSLKISDNTYKQKNDPVSLNKQEAPPHLVREPHLVERSSYFSQSPSNEDRSKLAALVSFTTLSSSPKDTPRLVRSPRLVSRGKDHSSKGSTKNELENSSSTSPPALLSDSRTSTPSNLSSGSERTTAEMFYTMSPNEWIGSPAFDEDHPDELSYQPFPIIPLLTTTSSPDDPTLVHLLHPNVGRILTLIDDEGSIAPMRFRPGIQTAQALFSQRFMGRAINLSVIEEASAEKQVPPPPGLIRKITTMSQD